MTSYVLPPPPQAAVTVAGESARFAVHRIYCVGQNYAAHAREMGSDPKRAPPFFFGKPPSALLPDGAHLPYPSRTENLQFEAELVVAIGTSGRHIPASAALAHVYGYAIGNDFTRRDLQAAAKDERRPWDAAKAFDHSAGIGAIQRVAHIGHPTHGAIWLTVNDIEKQRADIADLIWDVPGVIAELSTLFDLKAGDLIYTGTPAGVGPLRPGDVVVAGIDGLGTLTHTITTPTALIRDC